MQITTHAALPARFRRETRLIKDLKGRHAVVVVALVDADLPAENLEIYSRISRFPPLSLSLSYTRAIFLRDAAEGRERRFPLA